VNQHNDKHDEHKTLRDLLGLAAAGALDAGEQQRVDEHLRECSECQAEFQAWTKITGSLRDMPAPQIPAGLVARTRARMESARAAKAERWRHQIILGCLVLFAWIVTLLSFPLLRIAGNGLAGLLHMSTSDVNTWVALYLLLGWIGTGVAAGLLGLRRQNERTTI
jgi:anti-sigma factor RsiW